MNPDPAGVKIVVLVCGGRDYADRQRVLNVLDAYNAAVPIGTVVHGAARGADTFAGEWARAHPGVEERAFPAPWATYGKSAGAIRNARMLRETKPHLVIAFPGGRGTADMVRRARKSGVPRVVELPR
jgi:hypothetical protein